MSPLIVASIVVAVIMAGAILGGVLRTRLPQHHLADETKDMVKVGIQFLTLLTGLVLGLILTSAKSAFDMRSEEVQTAAAKLALLDHNLQQMGSTADPARQMLRQVVSSRLSEIWGNNGAWAAVPALTQTAPDIENVRDVLRLLSPADEAQRLAWSRSLQVADDLAQIRSLAIVQIGSTITMPLLVLLVSWLLFIAVAMNVFAPRNGTIHALNLLSAVSAASAIFLILEMDQPFNGVIHISDAPLRAVLLQMGH